MGVVVAAVYSYQLVVFLIPCVRCKVVVVVRASLGLLYGRHFGCQLGVCINGRTFGYLNPRIVEPSAERQSIGNGGKVGHGVFGNKCRSRLYSLLAELVSVLVEIGDDYICHILAGLYLYIWSVLSANHCEGCRLHGVVCPCCHTAFVIAARSCNINLGKHSLTVLDDGRSGAVLATANGEFHRPVHFNHHLEIVKSVVVFTW